MSRCLLLRLQHKEHPPPTPASGVRRWHHEALKVLWMDNHGNTSRSQAEQPFPNGEVIREGQRKGTVDRPWFSSVQSLSRAWLFATPWIRSTPGLPVHHQLPEFTQTHIHRVKCCHPAISSSVIPFSSCPQSLPASESFPMTQLFAWWAQ